MQTTNTMDEKRQMLNDIAYVGTDICESVLMIEILWIQLIQALQNHKIVFQNIQLGTCLSHKQQKKEFFSWMKLWTQLCSIINFDLWQIEIVQWCFLHESSFNLHYFCGIVWMKYNYMTMSWVVYWLNSLRLSDAYMRQ